MSPSQRIKSIIRNRLTKKWSETKIYIQEAVDPPGYVYNGKTMTRLFDEELETDDYYREKVDAHFEAQKRRVRDVVFELDPVEDVPLSSQVGKELLKEAIIEPGFHVLDYSPTMGSIALPAAQMCPFAHFDVVDDNREIIDQYLQFSKSHRISNIDFYIMDTSIPCRPDTYDLVLSNFGLVQTDDIRRDLRDIWRALKPGGKLLFSCWSTFEETSALNLIEAMLTEIYPDKFQIQEQGQWHVSELQAIFYDIDDYNLLGVREVSKNIKLEKGEDYWRLMMNPARMADLRSNFSEDEIENLKKYVSTFLDSQNLFSSTTLFATANIVTARKPTNVLERLFFD